jgi:hypothetical protein
MQQRNVNSYRDSQQDATVYQNLLFHTYMKISMCQVTHRPSPGAQNCTSSLWFCICERWLDIEVAGRCFCDATDIIKNETEEQKTFTKWLPERFSTPLQLLAEVYTCKMGLFWRKHNLDCTFLYFAEIKWFQENYEANTYI